MKKCLKKQCQRVSYKLHLLLKAVTILVVSVAVDKDAVVVDGKKRYLKRVLHQL
jgi:hypothetical protein